MSERNGTGYYTAAQFIKAIKGDGRFAKYTADGDRMHTGCMGIISKVAERVGCAWHTAKRYCTLDTTPFVTVAEAYQDEHEHSLDFTESQMFKQIQAGDGPMIRYHLSTKGKDRGYSERHEVAGPGGGPQEIKHSGTVGVQVYIPDNERGDRDPTTAGATGEIPIDVG